MLLYIKFYSKDILSQINHRYRLEDEIENQDLGEVLSAGTGDGYFDMTVRCKASQLAQIKALIYISGFKESFIEELEDYA